MRHFFHFYSGANLSEKTKEWEWERRGQTSVLFWEVGKQVATACNYTKAYVLCWPLLAVVVIWIVSSRMILSLRLYYEMLRQQAILDFDPLLPASDPLYLMLLWCFGNAALHFPLQYFLDQNRPITEMRDLLHIIGNEKLMEELHKVAFFYVCPSIVFLFFLWNAYDTEAKLLPLSKYFEEDPAMARDMLSEVEFIPEEVAAHVVKKKKLHFKDSDGNSLTGDDVIGQLIALCKQIGETGAHLLRRAPSRALSRQSTYKNLSPPKNLKVRFADEDPDTSEASDSSTPQQDAADPAADSSLKTASDDYGAYGTMSMKTTFGDLRRITSGEIKEKFSQWRLVSEMWPGRVLLDYRLCDESSTKFRFWWAIYTGVAALSMLLIFGILFYMSCKFGVLRDRAGLVFNVVVFLHSVLALALSCAFLKHAMLPQFKTHKI